MLVIVFHVSDYILPCLMIFGSMICIYIETNDKFIPIMSCTVVDLNGFTSECCPLSPLFISVFNHLILFNDMHLMPPYFLF